MGVKFICSEVERVALMEEFKSSTECRIMIAHENSMDFRTMAEVLSRTFDPKVERIRHYEAIFAQDQDLIYFKMKYQDYIDAYDEAVRLTIEAQENMNRLKALLEESVKETAKQSIAHMVKTQGIKATSYRDRVSNNSMRSYRRQGWKP